MVGRSPGRPKGDQVTEELIAGLRWALWNAYPYASNIEVHWDDPWAHAVIHLDPGPSLYRHYTYHGPDFGWLSA
jgi:hypothetical protein